MFILQEIKPEPSNQSGLRFISGIICKSKALRFERMLFRATRGNMLFNQASADEQIVDPISTETVCSYYYLYLIYYYSNQSCTQLVYFLTNLFSVLMTQTHDLLFRLRKLCLLCFSLGSKQERRF